MARSISKYSEFWMDGGLLHCSVAFAKAAARHVRAATEVVRAAAGRECAGLGGPRGSERRRPSAGPRCPRTARTTLSILRRLFLARRARGHLRAQPDRCIAARMDSSGAVGAPHLSPLLARRATAVGHCLVGPSSSASYPWLPVSARFCRRGSLADPMQK
ncbi:hypothetical protein BC834DRAFT_521127 [Gloeopeniophorella convolvens]|nr:hypothetical protein BC834DRAFT_521127 [Gloeopeniophorella convolvens]